MTVTSTMEHPDGLIEPIAAGPGWADEVRELAGVEQALVGEHVGLQHGRCGVWNGHRGRGRVRGRRGRHPGHGPRAAGGGHDEEDEQQ